MHKVLGLISWLDCLVFVGFLIPQLVIDPHAGIVKVISWLFTAIPYFVFTLPSLIFRDHILLFKNERPEFVNDSTFFQELVIRLVKYSFANLPSDIGRVFFKGEVVMPFYKFRLLRHGILPGSVPSWNPKEINQDGARGLWVKTFEDSEPDVVLYYIHGGGFTMGSPYFYLEFLISWASKLQSSGFKNPAVFALDYTLVPDAKFPTQLNEAHKGYQVVHQLAPVAEIIVCGDSAGGNIALSLLLHLARPRKDSGTGGASYLRRPSYATLISPWTVLVSSRNKNTENDFLDADQLHKFGVSYANGGDVNDPYKSPGLCQDLGWWEEALPVHGIHMVYGSQEVFTSEIKSLVSKFEKIKSVRLRVTEKPTIHAWPVVQAFIGANMLQREEGLEIMAGAISEALTLGKRILN
ncbi:hypothetical protein TWF192_001093 [Orbilia oligospora]|uniref:Alpha/beta hydrolase fold-3 domain-containing protein n=1 Tax=Orbilia oligospora TaxID=2813651 RepID=A0A6G1LUQ6_ORBOL|nr:hypothetical protein TWF679_000671 [Orbilia oligospora]KAF3217929.1 hypothetical protein TWF191_008346 [Orbilia oligospora]KAF3235002.1 hypothetical protein TWF192_001093 [Orbilia oligospora]